MLAPPVLTCHQLLYLILRRLGFKSRHFTRIRKLSEFGERREAASDCKCATASGRQLYGSCQNSGNPSQFAASLDEKSQCKSGHGSGPISLARIKKMTVLASGSQGTPEKYCKAIRCERYSPHLQHRFLRRDAGRTRRRRLHRRQTQGASISSTRELKRHYKVKAHQISARLDFSRSIIEE